MAKMPTYEELQQRIKALENGAFEHKQTERALGESEEKYRSLVEATSDWIWEVDNEGVYTYSNSKVKDILGYEPEEIIGKTPFDFMAPDEQERLVGWFRDTIEFRKPFEGMENTNIHKDGRHVLLETSGVPIVDPDGNLLGYRGIDRNITRRKQAEETLWKREEKYRSILENIEEAYYEVDMAGRFTFFNDSLPKITGYSADEIMGTNIRSYTDQNRAMEGEKAFKDVHATGKPVKGFSWEITRKDGSKKHAEVSASLIRDGEGKGIGFLGIIRDVSERKYAEQQIKSSLKEKETLLKEIHHRVKNNMQIIISLLRLQSANIKDKKYAGLFKDSANRMKSVALIHETLYRSKDLASIDFNGYVKSIANPLIRTYTVTPDRIKLNTTIEDISLGVDHAIPCGLIINELISNSLKYAFLEDGIGEIEISLRSINEDEMELTVSDNGIGIPAEIDVEKTESLGLQLVQLLAENQLDGTLALDRDGGTSFRIRFRE